ncbi:MAG: hypothetical protein HUU06_07800 [Planctomycetaceae bacterium]|nr:hypothetical protein [Planctomycetota bacterium]NUN52674.1 hypothetical protein [Planctomycetaceae bacterium]
MHRSLKSLALAAAGVLATALPASAGDFSGLLENLRGELQAREEALAGTTDKVEKKQLKAVQKALKSLDKPADDLGDDIKAAGAAVKGLLKAFPGEFEPSADSHLGSIYNTLFNAFSLLIEEDLDEVDGDLGGLSEKGRAKAEASLAKALAALGDEDADFGNLPAWAKLLAKAYKEALKAQNIVENDPGPTAGYSVSVDGKKLSPNKETVVVSLNELAGLLVFNASETKLGGFTVQLTPGSVLSTGEKGISVASVLKAELPLPRSYAASSGSFNVTALDNAANTITFTFSFTATGTAGTTGSVNVTGSYSGPFVSASDG